MSLDVKDFDKMWELHKEMGKLKFDSRAAENKMRMYTLETMLVQEEYMNFYQHLKDAVKGVDGSSLTPSGSEKRKSNNYLAKKFNIKFDTPEDEASYEAGAKEMIPDMDDIVPKYVKIFGAEEFLRRKKEVDQIMKEKVRKFKRQLRNKK